MISSPRPLWCGPADDAKCTEVDRENDPFEVYVSRKSGLCEEGPSRTVCGVGIMPPANLETWYWYYTNDCGPNT